MAVLPDLTVFGQRPIPNPQRAVATVSNPSAVGDAMAQFGGVVADVGFQIVDREATAAAKEKDVWVADKIRALLYDPEAGFTNLSGSAAVGARDRANVALTAIRDEALKGMNAPARRKIEAMLAERMESAKMRIDTHTGDQRKVWIDGASTARIDSAIQDSLFDPTLTARSLGMIEGELTGQAAREGWAPEVLALKIREKQSAMYRAQIVRAANSDPLRALEYLREHKDEMRAEDVIDLEGVLAPEVKRFLGRQKGAEAAVSGVSADYLSKVIATESGGNLTAKNPNSSALGPAQFTTGTWAQMMIRHPELGLTADGRTDAAQSLAALKAFTADNAAVLTGVGITPTNANLYAAHFLGAGGAVNVLLADDARPLTELVSGVAVTANPFLSGMTVGDFKRWASFHGGGGGLGYSAEPGGIDALLGIEDPVERQAALEEYDLRTKVAAAEHKATLAAAQSAAFQTIEAGGSVDDLPLEQRLTIGQEGMSELRTYQGKVRTDTPIVTDPSVYYMLRLQQSEDPAGFAGTNMLAYVNKLAPADFQEMVRLQTAKEDGSAASTLMETASRILRSAGIDTNADPGSGDAGRVGKAQTNLLRWQDAFIRREGRKPTMAEIDAEAGRQVLDVTINPPGMGNEVSGRRLEAGGWDIDETGLVNGTMTIEGIDVPAGVVAEQVAAMKAEGIEVTAEALVDRLIGLMGR